MNIDMAESLIGAMEILSKKKTKHIVCYSGGHSSAIVAVEVVRKYGKENVILLNHDINPRFENQDIKRFKKEVSDYLQVPITYANHENQLIPELIKNQFEVCIETNSFVNPHNRQILCTSILKTKPFYKFLKELPTDSEYIIYYGFDQNELDRVDKRKSILNDNGYDSDYPLALWGEGKFNCLKAFYKNGGKNFESICFTENYKSKDHLERTIFSTEEIGIEKPFTYSIWKHANCIGCLKAGQQHWYCVYVHDYEVFELGKNAEEIIGYSFGNFGFLKDVEDKFKKMKEIGIPASEHIPNNTFWKSAKYYLKQSTQDLFPCECFQS
jgi:hypothetical protein